MLGRNVVVTGPSGEQKHVGLGIARTCSTSPRCDRRASRTPSRKADLPDRRCRRSGEEIQPWIEIGLSKSACVSARDCRTTYVLLSRRLREAICPGIPRGSCYDELPSNHENQFCFVHHPPENSKRGLHEVSLSRLGDHRSVHSQSPEITACDRVDSNQCVASGSRHSPRNADKAWNSV